jgi:hypothetical protein
MPTLDKPLRQSVTLPSPIAKQVKRIAKSSSVSTSRVIADLVKTGLAAQEQEKRHFLGLIDNLATAKSQEDQQRIKEELDRMTFGE